MRGWWLVLRVEVVQHLASSHIVGKPEAPLPQEETHQDAQAGVEG